MQPILLKNGRIIDPVNGIDMVGNLLLHLAKCAQINPSSLPEGTREIDLTGKWVVPGLIDIHVHLREPGEEYKETIESGAQAAAAGGFTAVACMPNTKPVLDSAQMIEAVLSKAQKAACRVYPVGAISSHGQGSTLANMGEMFAAGAVAFTDDGLPVSDSQLMRRAMEYAGNYGVPIISHSEEIGLSRHGSMNEGPMSTRMGIIGIPHAAEEIMVYRDLALAELTGQHVHLAHISTKESVSLIRRAKANGCPVSAETAPHYFSLTEKAVGKYDTYAKMNPPLRMDYDVEAIKEGLQDGTLDVIASDHAPHSDLEKELEFDRAANGIIGLETSLSLALQLVRSNCIDEKKLVELMSSNPAKALGLPGGSLTVGNMADVTVIDPLRQYTYQRDEVVSRSKNSPFLGWNLTGKAVLTIVGGKVTYEDL
nr:dihydroorotase [Desulfobulbaceae bacterium]